MSRGRLYDLFVDFDNLKSLATATHEIRKKYFNISTFQFVELTMNSDTQKSRDFWPIDKMRPSTTFEMGMNQIDCVIFYVFLCIFKIFHALIFLARWFD